MLLLFLNFMFISTTFIIGKYALQYASPIFLIAFRMTVAGALLLGFMYFFRRREFHIAKKDIPLMLTISFFHIYSSFILEFWALQYTTSAKTAFMYNLSPFVTALFAYIWLSETISLKKWAGLIIGFLGFIPILIQKAGIEESVGSFFIFSLPEVALFASAAAAAYAWILIKRLMNHEHYSPMMINGFAMLTSGVGAFVTTFLAESRPYLKAPAHGVETTLSTFPVIGSFFTGFGALFLPFLFYTGLLILFSNVLYYNIYAHLLKQYSATFLSFAGITIPLFAAFLGWLFLGEVITWTFYVSLVIVAFGLYIFYQDEFKGLKETMSV